MDFFGISGYISGPLGFCWLINFEKLTSTNQMKVMACQIKVMDSNLFKIATAQIRTAKQIGQGYFLSQPFELPDFFGK